MHMLCSCSIGSHSTSDDQTGYQDMEEVTKWKQRNDPVNRLRGYMQHRGLWTEVRGLHAAQGSVDRGKGGYMQHRGLWTEVRGLQDFVDRGSVRGKKGG